MKAIRIHKFGGPEALTYEDVPEPQAGPGEIRIRVMAAGVNPVDWKVRSGTGGYQPALPLILGVDVAGVVDSVGAGVETFQVGDGVMAKTANAQGGYAEYTVVNATQAARKPMSVSYVEAAAIPTAGLTAWQALFDTAGLAKGQTVLIHGAAGGVGSFAVQFAKWRGARVIGTASGDHLAFVLGLGADEVIDYKVQRFEEKAHDVDVVFDTIGGDTLERSWGVLKHGGFLVTIVGTIPPGAAEAHQVRAQSIRTTADGGELAQIAALIDEQKIKPVVTTELPLAEARAAQEMSETHHARGKIVLRVAA
ncbi:MAG TPA: NADP-dependent oxidoreductase [Armatimonadota bacterium]|jgi:NADPH:quinone reductase-like Zn-dependent oxidoreductase